MPGGQHVLGLVVPDEPGHHRGGPQPAQLVGPGHAVAAELGHRLPEKRNARRVAVGQPGGQPVEQQIRDRGGCGGARRPQRGLRRLPDQGAAGQAPGDMRGPQRVQVGIPGQAQVQRLESLGGAQQQPGRVAGPAGVGDLGPQPVGPGPLQIIEGAGLGRADHRQRRVLRARQVLGLRRGQGAQGPGVRVGGQQGRAFQERRGRGDPAPGLGPAGRPLQLGCDLLVGPGRGLGQVPGAPVRIDRGVGGLGQHGVRLPPDLQRGRPVGRGAHQRMPEPHPAAELRQLRRRGRAGRGGSDAQPSGGPPHQRRVAGRVGRGQLQQAPRRLGQRLDLPPEAVLDPPGQRDRAAEPEPARQLRRGQPAGQFEQGQRVAVRVGDDLLPDPRVQRAGQHRVQ